MIEIKDGKILKVTPNKLSRGQKKRLKQKLQAETQQTKQYTRIDLKIELDFIAASYDHKRFYNTPEWKSLRYRAIKELGNICCACGASPRTGAVIQVDHIKPRSIFPELAFDINNLQILCKDCNEGKSNTDATDWR